MDRNENGNRNTSTIFCGNVRKIKTIIKYGIVIKFCFIFGMHFYCEKKIETVRQYVMYFLPVALIIVRLSQKA
jgi:hypothetical protein